MKEIITNARLIGSTLMIFMMDIIFINNRFIKSLIGSVVALPMSFSFHPSTISQLAGNFDRATEWQTNCPRMWHALPLTIILEKARIVLTSRYTIGKEGEGFERINFAGPRPGSLDLSCWKFFPET